MQNRHLIIAENQNIYVHLFFPVPLGGPYCKDSWWDSTPPPVGNMSQYGMQENGGRPQYMNETRFQTVSVDFRTDTVSVVCRTKGLFSVKSFMMYY